VAEIAAKIISGMEGGNLAQRGCIVSGKRNYVLHCWKYSGMQMALYIPDQKENSLLLVKFTQPKVQTKKKQRSILRINFGPQWQKTCLHNLSVGNIIKTFEGLQSRR